MIHYSEISPTFAKILTQSGWSSNRKVDVAEWVSSLKDEGFEPNAVTIAILESVGGLSILIPPYGINPYHHELRFDPMIAASGEFDKAADWQNQLGIRLFPIGEEIRTGNILWVGNDRRFYFGRDFGLCVLGDSFGEAMDRLAFPNSPLSIHLE